MNQQWVPCPDWRPKFIETTLYLHYLEPPPLRSHLFGDRHFVLDIFPCDSRYVHILINETDSMISISRGRPLLYLMIHEENTPPPPPPGRPHPLRQASLLLEVLWLSSRWLLARLTILLSRCNVVVRLYVCDGPMSCHFSSYAIPCHLSCY